MAELSRRSVLGGALAVGASAPMLSFNAYALSPGSTRAYSRRAVDLVRRSTVIDMLGLIKLEMAPEAFAQPISDQAAAEFRSSGITCIHNASGVTGYENVLHYLARWQGYIARNSHVFTGVGRVSDIDRAKREKKVAVIMGLQNSAHFRSAADVKTFYEIGQRVSQLTYNSQNLIGAGSTERTDSGISDFGESIIKAMNDVGMLVDVSHSGDRTTLDAIEISPKPIAFTHSNCRALNNHPRSKTDEAIRALARKGGVMGITGVRMFIKAKDPTSVVDMVDHIDHVVKLVGIEHVGLGSDADLNGYDDMSPERQKSIRAAYKASYAFRDKIDIDGFDHPRKMFDLTEELIKRRYSDANIAAILGGNFRRLLTAAWGG